MKYTVLKIVQKVLDSLDSDEVNSISDTVESNKVANLVEDVFYNMVTNKHIPEHDRLIKVEALSDSDLPNYLKLPARVSRIKTVRYNKSETGGVDYREIKYLDPEDFLQRVVTRDSTETNVIEVLDPSNNVTTLVINDAMPMFWTSFDDEYMVFDSFNSTVDNTLQESKTMVTATMIPEFRLEDTFVPDMDDNLFPMLLNEVKSWAHLELNQAPNQKAEQNARKQTTFYQAERSRIRATEENRGPDYGRR